MTSNFLFDIGNYFSSIYSENNVCILFITSSIFLLSVTIDLIFLTFFSLPVCTVLMKIPFEIN